MAILFDTSVAIALRDGSPAIFDRVARMRAAALSIVSVVELHGGIVRLPVGQDQRASALAELLDTLEVWEFGLAEAKACGRIILAVGISRTKVLDRMVAAQAAVADATLATLKARDFRNIPNLRVEDWS